MVVLKASRLPKTMKTLIVAALFCTIGMALADDTPPPPPFLAGAPQDVVKAFFELLKKDETKTDPEIEKDLDAWVDTLGGDYKAKFETFKKEMKAKEAELAKAHEEAVAKMTPEAKKADAELSKIAEDDSLNGIQKAKKIQAIYKNRPKLRPKVSDVGNVSIHSYVRLTFEVEVKAETMN
ncbi:unnamed protein product [Anisakis simplex]|uniref:SXP/RAL-2 family protein Ani s 5-like cation-binding domain-containing protein n=1 Tax=Anisakis simplex TaxID=6269 RepID=A0A3P6NWQ2_ANISI|nr:unnamed protein product [Anisakis simplex]